MAFTFGCIGVQQSLNGVFQGSGNTNITMILSLFFLFGIQIPVAYILSQKLSFGVHGLFMAFPITNVVITLITFIWYLRGSWKYTVLTEEGREQAEVFQETVLEEGGRL